MVLKGWAARRLARVSTSTYTPGALAVCSVNLEHLQHEIAGLGSRRRDHVPALRFVRSRSRPPVVAVLSLVLCLVLVLCSVLALCLLASW